MAALPACSFTEIYCCDQASHKQQLCSSAAASQCKTPSYTAVLSRHLYQSPSANTATVRHALANLTYCESKPASYTFLHWSPIFNQDC